MSQKLLLSILAVTAPAISVTGYQLLKEGEFCNIAGDCETSCCLGKKCAPTFNDCLALETFDRFVQENYCSIHVDCPKSRCCLHGECMSDYAPCFERYDKPLLYGAAVGAGIALFMMILAFLFTPLKPKPVEVKPEIKEEEFVDDGGPIYYEAEEKQPEVEENFKDDGGPIYYEADDAGKIEGPPPIIEEP